ncbi:MAG: efflux RND transporter periplasmic adaptor subunit [Eubacteriales bacterium]
MRKKRAQEASAATSDVTEIIMKVQANTRQSIDSLEEDQAAIAETRSAAREASAALKTIVNDLKEMAAQIQEMIESARQVSDSIHSVTGTSEKQTGLVEGFAAATATAPVLDQNTLSGVVKKIYPRAEEKQSALGIIQRRVPVIISLKESAGLKPGFEVRVAIETATRENVLTVPREAVRTTKDGQKEVMAVAGGRVRHRIVSTGISYGNNIEITGGLEEGDQIARDGSLDLAEKTRVK